MKNLNKLQINHEKLMKNEQLMTLKGGYGYNGACCICYNQNMDPMGAMAAYNSDDCAQSCNAAGYLGWYFC
ncbi:MAG: hypothetical protein RBS29_06980 [Bacteroidales bacterium]|nr:hypothetical protein [Bacteroidales bacterium]